MNIHNTRPVPTMLPQTSQRCNGPVPVSVDQCRDPNTSTTLPELRCNCTPWSLRLRTRNTATAEGLATKTVAFPVLLLELLLVLLLGDCRHGDRDVVHVFGAATPTPMMTLPHSFFRAGRQQQTGSQNRLRLQKYLYCHVPSSLLNDRGSPDGRLVPTCRHGGMKRKKINSETNPPPNLENRSSSPILKLPPKLPESLWWWVAKREREQRRLGATT